MIDAKLLRDGDPVRWGEPIGIPGMPYTVTPVRTSGYPQLLTTAPIGSERLNELVSGHSMTADGIRKIVHMVNESPQ